MNFAPTFQMKLVIFLTAAVMLEAALADPIRRSRQRIDYRGYNYRNRAQPQQYETTTTTTTTTPEPPPKPFKYAFAAGRAPGGKPDRYVEQEGDEQGVVRGSYTYLDPNWKWQKVGWCSCNKKFISFSRLEEIT